MRSRSTSEKPMMAFSGVRSSWDMLARNSDLCRLDLECGALTLQTPVQLCVDQGQGGLAGERLQQVADLIREVPGCVAADNQGTHDAAFAEHRDGHQGTPAALGQDAQVGIEWRVAKVREPHGVPPLCRLAEEGVIKAYPGA